MEFNLLLAGVGGQGILTIARAVSDAAVKKGFQVKQSEVHGMSQRGGAVQAHLRYADHPIHSDLIPNGGADLLLAVEPLEALRYTEYLSDRTVIVANSGPFKNIPDYPPVDDILDQITRLRDHVLIDAPKLAKEAGSTRAENIVMLGAAGLFLDFSPDDFQAWVREAFAGKGDRVVEVNRRALRIGRDAAAVYREGLRAGQTSRQVRSRMSSLTPEELAHAAQQDGRALATAPTEFALPRDSIDRIGEILARAGRCDRLQLFEHEVYRIVELAGAITPPIHRFLGVDEELTRDDLDVFPGDRVVLKIVSPQIIHKSDAGGLAFVPNSSDDVQWGMERLVKAQAAHSDRIAGVLIVEFVEQVQKGLGSELFVGIRQTREFGPVIAAGLGGIDTEYLAARMQPGSAVAKASAIDTTAHEFFEEFRKTAAYEILAGKIRGHESVVGDGDLIRCFQAFMEIARCFCMTPMAGVALDELEVNPFAFRRRQLVPLDGRGRLGAALRKPGARSREAVNRMLEPSSIAIAGVSGKRVNLGRIILRNIKDCGFPADRLYVIKQDEEVIDGVRCVPTLRDLPERVDLLVAAAPAEGVSELVGQTLPTENDDGPCGSVILIPGALGEKEGTQDANAALQASIQASRLKHQRTPVFLGGNCLGVRSRPGRYDTFFIPNDKLDPRRAAPAKRCALIAQSGGFLITRLSNLEFLDPTLTVSIGNQVDLTVSDVLSAVAERDDIDCIGVYVEGFSELDGLAFLRAVERATDRRKIVVFYKAGRTSAGRSAAMGHTASVAGDYDVCQSAVAAAGAIVTDTFKEFEQLLELATDLHGKRVGGTRIGAISNAGYEAVGMADAVRGARYRVEMPALAPQTRDRLARVLERHGLERLVDAKNPLDLTPMADDAAYEDCVRVMLQADEIDAVLIGCVPMTPALLTLPDEILQPESIAQRMHRLFVEARKPLAFVVDCGDPYENLARTIRSGGVPVMRSADQAVRSIGRYLCHRFALDQKAADPESRGPLVESALIGCAP